MKIISLQAENIKKLVAVEIKPDGNVVQITGKNGQGKTSVLDSIWWALAGVKNVQSVPIRKGEDKAKIRLDLGDLIVTRSFKSGKDGIATSSISVENASGARFPSPQSVLDKLIGSLSFDPLAFARMVPRDQFNTLRKFVPNVDFEAIDEANRSDYTKRTEFNRQAKALTASSNAIEVNIGNTNQNKKIDESALVLDMEMAGRKNFDIQNEIHKREDLQSKARDIQIHADRRRGEAEEMIADASDLEDEGKAITDELSKRPKVQAPVDISTIRAKINNARGINKEIDRLLEKKKYLFQAKRLEEEAEKLTSLMKLREQDKNDKIAAAKLPISGISFGDGSILMDGIPFDQISDSEQLRASLSIAMSLNPKLRVIRVRDGSLLDKDSMEIVSEMAKDKDFQVWIEKVDDSGKVGFVLEDGSLKSKEKAGG